jgi:hypothetical protein
MFVSPVFTDPPRFYGFFACLQAGRHFKEGASLNGVKDTSLHKYSLSLVSQLTAMRLDCEVEAKTGATI